MVRLVTSRGVEFNLLSFDYAKLQKADFHRYKWGREVVQRQYGERVARFTKEAQLYNCTFKFRGSPASRKAQIDRLHFETEYDISHEAVGRLYFDDTYIEVYMIESDTYPDGDGRVYTVNDVVFYAPYPFWIKEQIVEIFPTDEAIESEDNKGYDPSENRYGYPYSYCSAPTSIYIDTEHYKDSDFKMIIYGPAPSVQWAIGGNIYEVDYQVRENQYMVIDSRQSAPPDKQCYVVSETGVHTNVFDYRNPNGDLFKKIPSGHSILNYPRTYGMQLTIFKESSEPR